LDFNYFHDNTCLDPNAGYRNPDTSALTAEQVMDNYRISTISTMTDDTRHKSSSTISSTSLTQVSDISDEPKLTQNANATGSSQTSVKADTTSGHISSTDVILEVASDTNENKAPSLPISTMPQFSSDEESPPPPLPSSEPPVLDDDTVNNKFQFGKKPNL